MSILNCYRLKNTYINSLLQRLRDISLSKNMDKNEILKRIEQNSTKSQEIINFIQKELPFLQKAALQKQQERCANDLKEKNIQLKQELDYWLKKVTSLEVSLGIQQCPLPSMTLNIDAKEPSLENNASEVKKECFDAPLNPTSKDASTVQNVPKKESKSKEKAPKAQKQQPVEDDKSIDVSRLDLRVGRILNAKKHPDAESLYVEEIDVGEEKPRTVVSGLVKFVPLDQMQNRLVVVLCNLKPAKMRGVMSEAMVMCASTPEKAEILTPPGNSIPGDRIVCDEYPGQPDSILPPKKKIFEQISPDLKTDGECNATYKSALWKVKDKGVIKSITLTNVQIK